MRATSLLLLAVLQQVAGRYHFNHRAKNLQDLESTTLFPRIEVEKVTVIDGLTGITYNPYSKHHPGRHVCATEKQQNSPQRLCKPVYKRSNRPCANNNNEICTSMRLVYEAKAANHWVCCPGWKQATNRSYGCNKPHCPGGCLNGGTCAKPETCVCRKGFFGRSCEHDVDECREEKPCDQICINAPGGFRCECRENYSLQEDGQTCRRDDDEPGFEFKEMEMDSLDKRINKLETTIEEKKNETQKELTILSENVENINKNIVLLKNKIGDVESYKFDLNSFKAKMHQLEKKSGKIDELSARYDKMKKCAFYNKICI